jgi:hypothetical protein
LVGRTQSLPAGAGCRLWRTPPVEKNGKKIGQSDAGIFHDEKRQVTATAVARTVTRQDSVAAFSSTKVQ